MSRAWAGGSTTAWRRTRAYVLRRDRYRCQLGHPGCTTAATEAHHTRSRALVGDDPAFLVASCRACNLAEGEPGSKDPRPSPRTRW